jgi:hypothetical protein
MMFGSHHVTALDPEEIGDLFATLDEINSVSGFLLYFHACTARHQVGTGPKPPEWYFEVSGKLLSYWGALRRLVMGKSFIDILSPEHSSDHSRGRKTVQELQRDAIYFRRIVLRLARRLYSPEYIQKFENYLIHKPKRRSAENRRQEVATQKAILALSKEPVATAKHAKRKTA